MAEQTAPVRVFLVEDQPALLKQLSRALAGFSELTVVGSSQDGEDAVRQISQSPPDVVLLDLELPSLGGIEVTEQLKRRVPQVEVLILTSFDDEQKVYQAMQAGASGYLVKRVGPDKIRSAVHDVLAGGVVVEAQIAKRFWNYFQSVQGGASAASNRWGLSPVEVELLGFLAKGLSNAEVGRAMSMERRTVRTHLSHIYQKMQVRTHVDAVVLALRAGVISL